MSFALIVVGIPMLTLIALALLANRAKAAKGRLNDGPHGGDLSHIATDSHGSNCDSDSSGSCDAGGADGGGGGGGGGGD